VRDVEREIPVESLRGRQDHQVADKAAPIVAHQQDAIEAERVEEGEDVAGDILLRPSMRRGSGPAVPGQVGRDDAQAGRRVGQKIPVHPVVLRPPVQREDGASIRRTRLGHVKPHASGFDERSGAPRESVVDQQSSIGL
jgi:hypothetical protein